MAHFVPDSWESGSTWRRWNPHIHAPGTLLNDQFGDDWEGYLATIESAVPVVEVLGITDYLSVACYKAVKAHHQNGRLPKVRLLFPNVEFRLSVETDRRKGINVHLLFCPDDGNHVEEIERVLASLTFEFREREYRCTHTDLLTLGRAYNPDVRGDDAARSEGANQFKVTLDQLRRMFRNDAWVARNCIVAVAAGSNDGTAGLNKDASFTALRREIEGFSHVIFSSTPSSREFWLGRHVSCDAKTLEREYGGRKPCLHGCDGHSVAKTCVPDEARYCWVKGDPTFDSLRQTLLEPDERVWIGAAAPDRHDASQCIASMSTHATPWLANETIPLNSGLVAIIGSRGSGKTAMADMVAIGADVVSPLELETSFIHRASRPVDYLGKGEVHLCWGDGTAVGRGLNPQSYEKGNESVRYLSQQFVEQLCSAAGLAVELRKEIERVIFDSTDPLQRYDTETFTELADIHLDPIRRERQVAKEAIENTSVQVNAEELLQSRVPILKKEREERHKRIEKTKNDMKSLVPKDKEERAKRLAELEAALGQATAAVDRLNRVQLRVDALQQEVVRIRTTLAPQRLDELKEDHQEADLSPDQWEAFGMVFKGNVDGILDTRKADIAKQIKELSDGVPSQSIDQSKDPLSKWPQKFLLAERNKVKKEVGIDVQKQKSYAAMQRSLENDERQQQRSATDLVHAEGAAERKKGHIDRRRTLYVQVLQSYLDEQTELENLYAPLQQDLKDASGSLSRLRFTVSREIDLKAWIDAGEDLLDLRKDSMLRGHGALQQEAERMLMTAWRTGTAEQVGEAMQGFIKELGPEIINSMPASITAAEKPEWLQQIATWIYSTDHIQMRYSVTYDGVAIEQLSPGTRGIVLLLLYLVIDTHDRRPLIIDQPEENLDPKSVFDELVPHFRDARKRRQVIIVTHNANLVVNTDADQVIVATSEPNPAGGLPTITYRGGSIENHNIRTTVCEILEGGEQAFRERERRYRLQRDKVLAT